MRELLQAIHHFRELSTCERITIYDLSTLRVRYLSVQEGLKRVRSLVNISALSFYLLIVLVLVSNILVSYVAFKEYSKRDTLFLTLSAVTLILLYLIYPPLREAPASDKVVVSFLPLIILFILLIASGVLR